MAIEKKEVFTCSYNDIEAIILSHFSHRYEIMPMEEIGSSQYAAVVKFRINKGTLADYDQRNVDALKAGTPHQFSIYSILKELVNENKLEEGIYYVDISW